MNNITNRFSRFVLILAVVISASCDKLNLVPEDYYSGDSFWTSEAQFDGYVFTLHKYMRDLCKTHVLYFGELRSGIYKTSSGSSDGSTHLDGTIMLSNLSEDTPGLSNFGGYYGAISQTNLFIKRLNAEGEKLLPEAKRNNYLGIAHGIRAFLYFDLYRAYGGVPIRLDTKVIDGITDPRELYLARSSAAEVLALVKADIDSSLTFFGEEQNLDPYNHGEKITWSRFATLYLAGEVYLWSAKVSVSDTEGTQPAIPSDADKAATYLNEIISSNKFGLEPSYADIFDASKKGGKEVIFAIRYKEGEADNPIGVNYTYISDGRGSLANGYGANGEKFGDPLHLNSSGGGQWYEYKDSLFNSFDNADVRKSVTFVPCYSRPTCDSLVSAVLAKNMGHVNGAGRHIFDGDQIYYRYAGVLLLLAEALNFTGTDGYQSLMDQVRTRAGLASESPSGFKAWELAIFREREREFVNEGCRWWDLCRMTTDKEGGASCHLVFSSEVAVTDKGEVAGPVLDYATESYKVLWPIDKALLGSDPLLVQTVGY